ncbi:hypothetical protein [Effusibacillus consociatus]|uniref:HTH-type transcriptional repressor NicS C-terminal domain-containing protein n=1 Tax=Effusibacillus consociatus TaxID=1117041 RepID=A0ABV9Q1Q2_9BACL
MKLIIREVIRFRMEDPEMARIIQQEMFLNSPRSGVILSFLVPVWGQLRELLQEGQRQGIFHMGSVNFTVLLILGSMIFPNSVPIHEKITLNEQRSFEERVEDTIHFVLGGLGYESNN